MGIIITEDGVKRIPSLSGFIGKDADEAATQIIEQRDCIKLSDCIGLNGHRNITLMSLEKRIEIVCETDQADEVINESIAPSEATWYVIDIFMYHEGPKPGKGYYSKIK